MYILYFALAALGGALLAAVLGWLESGEAFVARKFFSSVIRAVFAAAFFAISSAFIVPTTPAEWVLGILGAIVGGAGIDAGGNRIAGAIAARHQPTPPT